MSVRTRSMITLAVAVIAIVAMASTALAATTVARWKLDDPKLPKNGPVVESIGGRNGVVGDVTQTLIKRRQAPLTGAGTSTYSYYFKGWREAWSTATPCAPVTAGGALVTVPDPGTDPDGGGGTFDPKGRPFEFTLSLKGQAAATPPVIPISGCSGTGGISLNVFQQGLFNNAGGMYKLQIEGNGTPNCLFQDNAVLTQGTAVPHQLKVDSTAGSVYNGADWFTVTCRLVRDVSGVRAEITVTNVTQGTPAVTTTKAWTDPAPFGGINPCTSSGSCPTRLQNIYFGKKPGSTDPRDAFAGWLDNISFRYLD